MATDDDDAPLYDPIRRRSIPSETTIFDSADADTAAVATTNDDDKAPLYDLIRPGSIKWETLTFGADVDAAAAANDDGNAV